MSTGGLLSVAGRDVRVTNLDKVLYPSTGTTKADVLQYYLGVAPLILKQLRDRPVSRKRWPDGVEADSFIEKNLPRVEPLYARAPKPERVFGPPVRRAS